jgi:hypothetical protein
LPPLISIAHQPNATLELLLKLAVDEVLELGFLGFFFRFNRISVCKNPIKSPKNPLNPNFTPPQYHSDDSDTEGVDF